MPKLKRIGVLTGGGDAPGLNAVIRAVVKAGVNNGIEVVGLEDSFDGLIEPNRSRVLTAKDVTGILRRGGTILGTINRGDPFA
jgi:ATP-dependent phosphofructokinase / diphosphate-dependent phosphofructokinase